MGKQTRENLMIAELKDRLDKRDGQQDFQGEQLNYLIRLIQGDSNLSITESTGLINEIKKLDNKLRIIEQKNTHIEGQVARILHEFSDRIKRRERTRKVLTEIGKVAAWFFGIVATIIAIFAAIREVFNGGRNG